MRLDTENRWPEAIQHVGQLADVLAFLARLKRILQVRAERMLPALLETLDRDRASV